MKKKMSPILTWGYFHERSHFARSTIPEEKWGTSLSLVEHLQSESLLAVFAYTTNILRFPSIFHIAKLSNYRDRA